MTQPLKLREYQKEGVKFVLERKGRAIIGDDAGLGKTPQALAAVHYMATKHGHDFLVVCPKSATGVWQQNIRRWLKISPFTYLGKPAERGKSWERMKARKVEKKTAQAIITNFELLPELLKKRGNWPVMIVDEAHFARNRKSKRFFTLRNANTGGLLLLTGSPIVKGPQDTWTLLHLVAPDEFRSYWKFVNEYCETFPGAFGGVHISGYKNNDPEPMKALLAKYMIRRRKAEVLTELPPLQRISVPLPLEGEQARIYAELVKEMMVILANESGEEQILLTPNKIALIVRLRQLLVTPALIGGPDTSVMLDAMEEMIQAEWDAGRPAVVFTPFTKAIPIIRHRLERAGVVQWIGEVRGGMSAEKTTAITREFQNSTVVERVLICQVLSATSFDAFAAEACFNVGYDWTPENQNQAESRLHRSGQTGSVRSYYFMTTGTIDAHVMKILDKKTTWSEMWHEDVGTFLNPHPMMPMEG